MGSRGLSKNNVLATSIEPIVSIGGVSLATSTANNDEETSLHTSPQNSSMAPHSMESSPHSILRPHESRGSHRQVLQGGILNNQGRSSLQKTQSPKGQQKSLSRLAAHENHTINASFRASQEETAMHSQQSHTSPSGHPNGMHQNPQKYHSYEPLRTSLQTISLHHLNHSAQMNMPVVLKFGQSPTDTGKRSSSANNVNAHNIHSTHSLSLNPRSNPHNTHTHNTHNTHSVHTPRIGSDNEPQYNQASPTSAFLPIQETQRKHTEVLSKLENEIVTLNEDISYFRHVVDFQSLKIDKLTLLLLDVLHNKEVGSMVQQLQNIQASEPFSVQEPNETVASMELVLDLLTPHDNVHNLVHESMHDVESSMAAISTLSSSSIVDVPDGVVLLGGTLEPLIHQVAQAAVQAQSNSNKRERNSNQNHSYDRTVILDLSHDSGLRQNTQHRAKLPSSLAPRLSPSITAHKNHSNVSLPLQGLETVQNRFDRSKAIDGYSQPPVRRKDSMSVESLTGIDVSGIRKAQPQRKKPKLSIDFLHNPMTVKEIYYEFTKGFQGQPPLRELDNRFGKHQWRGDSRTKESKRFQRRKKICDAIERGMSKYAKSAEEIIQYIEDFRKDKSLTWVMNGNLPKDLLE